MSRPSLPAGVRLLDVELFGVEGISCSYVIDSAEPVLIETGPTTVLDSVVKGLAKLKIEPKHIVVTHIHLDHAGGVGHVARAFPDATIWVHEFGARHVVDPSRLLASARRIFGDAMDTLWGDPDPVPEARVNAMDEGTVIPLGDRELHVLYTPGHARHEVTLLDPDARIAFIGDTAGIMLADTRFQKPATPPPEFDLEAALDSVARLKGLAVDAFCFTHYGPAREPALDRAVEDLRQWDRVLKPLVLAEKPMDELVGAVAPHSTPPETSEEYAEAMEKLSGLEASVSGYQRYYQKRFMQS